MHVLRWATVVTTTGTMFASLDPLPRFARLLEPLCMCRQVLDINALMFIAVAGAIALQDYVEGAAVLVLFGVAQWLEARSSAAARDAISSVLALRPETAILAGSGELRCFLGCAECQGCHAACGDPR